MKPEITGLDIWDIEILGLQPSSIVNNRTSRWSTVHQTNTQVIHAMFDHQCLSTTRPCFHPFTNTSTLKYVPLFTIDLQNAK